MSHPRAATPVLVAVAVAVLSAGCAGPRGASSTPATRGERLYVSRGCVSCHSTDGSRLTGPTWRRLYGSRVELDHGTAVVADEAYLRESIRDPSAKTVKGYAAGLMATVIHPGSLRDEQIDALVAYIKTLR